MSIFIRFLNKNYKLPNALTLGRGEPFDVEDRSLARAHARIIKTKDKWKIKDLNSDCGITVNDKLIKPERFVSIKPGDKIFLGNIPLEIHEELQDCVEVKNFTAERINNYSVYIYGALFVLAMVVAFTGSRGDVWDDVLFLLLIAAFLKLANVATYALKTVYFPVQVVVEANLTKDGATFHIAGKNNFSFKYEHIQRWYIIGKCFFVKAYDKNLIFLLSEGTEDFARALRDKCSKKRATAEPVLEKMALLPLLFIFIAWASFTVYDNRFFQFLGHGFGLIGTMGLLAFFLSDHLRELLPIPAKTSSKQVSFALVGFIAISLSMQFGQLQSNYKTAKAKEALSRCEIKNTCSKFDFGKLNVKKLGAEELVILEKICTEGNPSACRHQRRPASK